MAASGISFFVSTNISSRYDLMLHHLKKETLAQVFSCEFCEIYKNTLFTEHLWTTAFANHGGINHNLYFYKYLRPGNSAIWHLSIIFVVVNESLI